MRSDKLLWLLLIVLFGAVVTLAINHESGEVAGLDLSQFASLVSLLSIAVFIGAMAWPRLRGRLGESLMAAAFWVVLAALLAVVYTYRDPLRAVGERVVGQLVPGYVIQRADGPRITAQVTRGQGGEFAVNATINGAGVPMLVDTGASTVVLTSAAARAAGLNVDALTYDVTVETANGRARAASVLLDTIIVGGIVERRVPALVSAPGALRMSLLGMSFLARLDAFAFKGDQLVLTGPPAP